MCHNGGVAFNMSWPLRKEHIKHFFFRKAGEFCAQGSGLRYLVTDYIIPFAK